MKKPIIYFSSVCIVFALVCSFREADQTNTYEEHYRKEITSFLATQQQLIHTLVNASTGGGNFKDQIKPELLRIRKELKGLDFWLRYLEPTTYKKINGPLAVEWETEAFEKFEKPYRRVGAGYTLAWQYLDEENVNKDSLLHLLESSLNAFHIYLHDSIILSLESVFSALAEAACLLMGGTAWAWLGAPMTRWKLLGCALMFAGVLVSQVKLRQLKLRRLPYDSRPHAS